MMDAYKNQRISLPVMQIARMSNKMKLIVHSERKKFYLGSKGLGIIGTLCNQTSHELQQSNNHQPRLTITTPGGKRMVMFEACSQNF